MSNESSCFRTRDLVNYGSFCGLSDLPRLGQIPSQNLTRPLPSRRPFSMILPTRYPSVSAKRILSVCGLLALTVLPVLRAASPYDLTGFSSGNTGGGQIAETDTARYKKVFTATDLVAALKDKNTRVIEIMNDLNLGWNEIPAAAKVSPISANNTPLLHPVLLSTGVSKVVIQDRNASKGNPGLTLFSANGATLRHVGITVKRSENIFIRNLKFDELWEWDESSKGNYDKLDWDYLTIEECKKVWIDHCQFGKAYDGLIDVKKGSSGVTISWCKFTGDDGSANSFVRRQINALEAKRSSYAMYNYFRTAGMTVDQIVQVAAPQKKGHLVGSTEFASDNPQLEVTLHHNYYLNIQDRLPRLRGGNAHAYNLYVDSRQAYVAKKMRATFTNANSTSFHFDVTSNAAISTESGAVLVEKCHLIDVVFPLRNNQVDAAETEFTGKIRALDTLYSIDGSLFRGSSETSGSPLKPVPAPVLAFSWNGFSNLPYSYTADDPTSLASRLTATDGAGSGKLTWAKANWLRSSY